MKHQVCPSLFTIILLVLPLVTRQLTCTQGLFPLGLGTTTAAGNNMKYTVGDVHPSTGQLAVGG